MNANNISNIVASLFLNDPQVEPFGHELRLEAAFGRRRAAILAVPESELIPINIDVLAGMQLVLAKLPGIVALRPQVALMPSFDVAGFDALEDDTLALGFAHGLWRTASKPHASLPALGAAAVASRDTFAADAAALARRGLLDGDAVQRCRSGVGYRAVADDLLGLGLLLRGGWDRIAGVTAVKPDEIENALHLVDSIFMALAERDAAAARVAEAALVRQKAFTLWVKAYDQARRAVAFLRWGQGDANEIAPSLYAGRGNGGAHPPATTGSDVEASDAPAHAGTDAARALANGSAAQTDDTAPSDAEKPVPIGYPGSRPLVS